MFIRVGRLININTNIHTLQLYQYYQYVFSLKQLALSVKTHSTPRTINRRSILNPPKTRLEVSLIETPFLWQPHLCLSTPLHPHNSQPSFTHPHNSQPSFTHPFSPLARGLNRRRPLNNSCSDCYLGNLITSDLITLNILRETPISIHTNTFHCYAFHIQINVTVVLLLCTLQMLPFYALPCWVTRLLYWATTLQSNLASPG